MADISYRSNQIKLNYPNKVLGVNVTSIVGKEYWPYANGSGDKWWSGGVSPKFYRWTIVMSVTEQTHGSNLTRDDFVYNGLDINVGDWIANATDGRCLKIISISAKTKLSVTCVVEDWLRYNTFKNSAGVGVFSTGQAIVFTLNENGIPMLDPLPSSAAANFYPLVMSRFQYLNPQLNYVLHKTNHGLTAGDVVSASANGFVKTDTTNADKLVGVVTEAGPGPDMFMIMPNNRIIDFEPGIPGVQGDYIYANNSGRLSNVASGTSRVVFLHLQNAIPTVITGNINDPTVANTTTIALNGVSVTFSNPTGNANVFVMANAINANSNLVVAEAVSAPTIVSSVASGTAYGLVGGYPPFSAAFNSGSGNITVNFTSSGAVYAGVSTPQNMAADINAANIPNLSATATSTVLTLTESNGNAINIYNVSPDINGRNFVGASNISGLPATTAATTSKRLRLTRSDGGEILIFESTEIFQNATGVFSAHNGQIPLAMNIEQGLRTGGTTVVADIAARNSLSPMIGDQAHVLNKGDGEWGLYLYDGTGWQLISTADSATTDAKTLVVAFDMPLSGNTIVQEMGNVSPGRKITSVSVDVDNILVGATNTPTVTVGTLAVPDLFMDSNTSVLTEQSVFITNPEYVHDATNTQDIVVYATINHYGATAGNVVVKLTYI